MIPTCAHVPRLTQQVVTILGSVQLTCSNGRPAVAAAFSTYEPMLWRSGLQRDGAVEPASMLAGLRESVEAMSTVEGACLDCTAIFFNLVLKSCRKRAR